MSTLSKRLISGLILTLAVTMAQAVPTGAFIRKAIHNTGELIAQVKNDAVVRDRYVRHFRLTESQLVDYIGTLHPAKLAHDGVFMVYNVHSDNVIRGRVFSLRKGTLVLADRSGRAILKLECGNPMTFGLPPITAEAPVTSPVSGRALAEGSPEPVESSSILEPSVAPVPPARIVAAQIIPTTTTGVISGGRGGFGILPLVLVGGLGLLIHHESDHHYCPPGPEPATLLIMGVGAAGVALRKRRNRA